GPAPPRAAHADHKRRFMEAPPIIYLPRLGLAGILRASWRRDARSRAPMRLHHLKIFYTVAQRRSITGAAAELLLSQPAVSVQLKALERELGVPLFERGGAKLRLTQAGEVLHRAAVSILSAKDEAERAITELRGGNKGRLILGAGTTGGMYVLPRVIQAYKGLWPETEILLQVGTTDQILEKLLQNVLDMGLGGGPIDDRPLTLDPLSRAG